MRQTKTLLVLLLLTVLQLSQLSAQGSDTTFGIFRQKEYYFSNSFKLNWFKAVEYCRTRGMFLLSVRNAEEREDIIKYLASTGYTKSHKGLMAWMSANDLGEEGEFHWASTGERVNYPNWSDTEPNDYRIDDCTGEDCAILEYWDEGGANYNYTFNDRSCMRDAQHIALSTMESKRLANLVAILVGFLAIGLISTQQDITIGIFREKSYYFGNTFKLNWYKASEYCRTRGMFLVAINNDEQLNGVVEYIEKSGFTKTHGILHMWTSGNDLGEEGQFFWGSTGERHTYDRWTKNEPNNEKHDNCTYENCLVLEYYQPWSINYTFDDRPCGAENFFMCETLYD
uniref:C-type lectin domain-containing protein n=1 Tax=Anopheles dirus TaxID=7168 RepID=A0A182NHZ3_9DIPT